MSGCTCVFFADAQGKGIIGKTDPDCSVHGEGAQPLPVSTSHPIAHKMVQEDLEARLAVGIKRYGQPLQPFNGRNSLRDAYEEILDLSVYLRTALYERESLDEATHLDDIDRAVREAAEVIDLVGVPSEEEDPEAWNEAFERVLHCGTCTVREVMSVVWPPIERYINWVKAQHEAPA